MKTKLISDRSVRTIVLSVEETPTITEGYRNLTFQPDEIHIVVGALVDSSDPQVSVNGWAVLRGGNLSAAKRGHRFWVSVALAPEWVQDIVDNAVKSGGMNSEVEAEMDTGRHGRKTPGFTFHHMPGPQR